MRTIVALVLTQALYAQPPLPNPQISLLEKKIADGRETQQDRIRLLSLYVNAHDFEGRRKQILWLIEHRPELPEFRNSQFANPAFDMRPGNSMPDAVGFDQAAQLWRAHAAEPDASPKVIANAAYFFRFADRDYALSILKKAAVDHPSDVDIAKVRGLLDVLSMGGLMDIPINSLASDQHARMLPSAKKAREDVESSRDPTLLAAAADFMSQDYFLFNISFQDYPALGGDDALDLAERWVARAMEIQPGNKEWKQTLARIYTNQGQQAADPRFRVQLLRKADAQIDNWPGLPQLAMAEYNAGDDDAALKTAQRMLDRKPPPANFINTAHTVIGLITLDQKHVGQAKAELLESARVSVLNEPNRTLAQALIDAGERDIVLKYLEMCRSFWKNDHGSIDHYVKMVNSPGQHDVLTPYMPGLGLRGRVAPKLPTIDFEHQAVVAVQFRNPGCKDCGKDFEALKKIASMAGATSALMDAEENAAVAAQYEVETFPTVVLIYHGRINDVMGGPLNEGYVRSRIERLAYEASRPQRLPPPVPLAADKPDVLAWSPLDGAESYLVQWDQRDEKGWISDRDDHFVRVIPTDASSVILDPGLGETPSATIRWRVLAVSRAGAGAPSEWRELTLSKP